MTTDFNEPTIKIEGPVKPKIPDIDIEAKIGEGGMGMVFRGRQPYLDRLVAVKVLSSQMSQNRQFVERFQREAKILAGLNHPNIVGCYAAGATDKNECYLAMEFIDGPNLRQWIGKHGKLDEMHALQLGRDLLQALRYAHERDIIHRDVKPENVLMQKLTGREVTDPAFPYRTKLVDLGLARPSSKDTAETKDMAITMQGTILGTPATMAPEQFDDPDNVDHKADIYGVGCVLYHALTGEMAYPEQAITAIIKRKSTGEVPRPGHKVPTLRQAVCDWVADMLQPRREDRPEYSELIRRSEQLLANPSGSSSTALSDLTGLAGATQVSPGARTSTGAPSIDIMAGGSRVRVNSSGVQITQSAAPGSQGGKRGLVLAVVAMLLVSGAVVAYFIFSAKPPPQPPIVNADPVPHNPPPPPPVVSPTPDPATPPVTPPAIPPVTTPTPPAPPTFADIPVEAAEPEAPVTFDVNSRNFLDPDKPLKNWTFTPKTAFGPDDDFDGGLVGHDISFAEQPAPATPVKLEGDVVLYNNVGGMLEARANQAGVAVQFDNGRCLALALSTPGASTLATVERWDVGRPGMPAGATDPVKKPAHKTATFPGVLVLKQTERVHWVITIQEKTVTFEVNGQPLAQAARLPGKIATIALYVNGTPTQTASFRNIRYYQPKK